MNVNFKLISIWYGIFSICILILSIILAATLNMWSLVYSVLLLAPSIFIVKILINQFYKCILRLVDKKNVSKKRIIWSSIVLYLAQSIFMLIPFLIGILINVFVSDHIFNVYMLIAFFVAALILINVSTYYENQKDMKNKQVKPKEKTNNG